MALSRAGLMRALPPCWLVYTPGNLDGGDVRMTTSVVSGRVETRDKNAVDICLRNLGLTANDVIASLWRYIARTGEVPEQANPQMSQTRLNASARLEELRRRVPLGTSLSTMTDEDVKRALERRDA